MAVHYNYLLTLLILEYAAAELCGVGGAGAVILIERGLRGRHAQHRGGQHLGQGRRTVVRAVASRLAALCGARAGPTALRLAQ